MYSSQHLYCRVARTGKEGGGGGGCEYEFVYGVNWNTGSLCFCMGFLVDKGMGFM